MATSAAWRSPGALATDPQLIALDEPAAGMNATEKVQLRELIDRIPRTTAPSCSSSTT